LVLAHLRTTSISQAIAAPSNPSAAASPVQLLQNYRRPNKKLLFLHRMQMTSAP
jgi:hypothetical protein